MEESELRDLLDEVAAFAEGSRETFDPTLLARAIVALYERQEQLLTDVRLVRDAPRNAPAALDPYEL